MRRLFNFRPLAAITLSLVLGITAFLAYAYSYYFLAVLLILLPVCAWIIYGVLYKKFNYKIFIYACICQIFLFAGFIYVNKSFNSFYDISSGVTEVSGRFIAAKEYDYSFAYSFDDCSFTINGKEYVGEEILVYSYNGCNVEFGDYVTFTANIEGESKYLSGGIMNVSSFIYGMRFKGDSDFSKITVSKERIFLTEKIRLSARENLFNGMDNAQAAVTYAMLFGDTSEIEKGTLDNIRLSGIAHIFAVSGLHVGFISATLLFLLKKLKANGLLCCIIAPAVTLLYVAICNFTVSSVRAFVMFTIALIVSSLGRKNDLVNSISLSALIILLIKPQQLYTPGFLLSFTSVLGICLLTPTFNRILSFCPEKLRGAISVSLGAQIGSLPVSVCFFGNVPLLALLLNLFVIPLVSVLFIIDLVAVLFTFIFSVPQFFLLLPDKLTTILTLIVSNVNFSVTTVNASLSFIVLPVCLASLFFASDKVNLGYKTKAVIFTIGFGLSMVISQFLLF